MSFKEWRINDTVILSSLKAVIHYSAYYITIPHLLRNYFIYFLLEANSVTTRETAAKCQILNILSPDSIRGS